MSEPHVNRLEAFNRLGIQGGQSGERNTQNNLWINLPSARTHLTPRQLPPPTPHFAGREVELGVLDSLLGDRHRTADAVLITAIEGTAGIGKTALAVHWSNRVADRFPDGQLYVNLRGFDPGGVPIEPGDALHAFLEALDVAPDRIPASIDARTAMYRSLLQNRRMLVLLDNARDTEQVRPLIPGRSRCLALVTSRRQLNGLVIHEGATPLVLSLPTQSEAVQLLSRRIGDERLSTQSVEAIEIARQCSRLPLALAIVAARAVTNPHLSLSGLMEQLREAGSLAILGDGHSRENIRSVFSWSYQQLERHAAAAFQAIGIHPGATVSVAAIASVLAIPASAARDALSDLVAASLIEEVAVGRYTLHDLLRSYASELAELRGLNVDHRGLVRLLDHYLYTLVAANDVLDPHRDAQILPTAPPHVVTVVFDSANDALSWLTTERNAILRIIERASSVGLGGYVWRLSREAFEFLKRQGHLHDFVHSQELALKAAVQQADTAWRAYSLHRLAGAYRLMGRYLDAHEHYVRAITAYRDLGDPAREAESHRARAQAFEWQGRHREALSEAQKALSLFKEAKDVSGEAASLNAVGWYMALLGEYENALPLCKCALELQHRIGDIYRSAATWDSLAYIFSNTGLHRDAFDCYARAGSIWSEAGDLWLASEVEMHIGEAQQALGRPHDAVQTWRRALAMMVETGHPDYGKVQALLAGIDMNRMDHDANSRGEHK